ncbi:MAG TPA: Ldh family oxidoreductase, partial [Myxococcales bacterium]
FLLDMATSAVAQGKVRVAYNRGEKVSPEWLLDDAGNPTSDPRYGVVEPWGALRAFGLHKGYGLALACELLGGALTGGGTVHGRDRSGRSVWNGMLSILIDPARLDANGLFGAEAAEFLRWVRASPLAPGFDKVRIAGDPERECRMRREQEGIAVDAATWDEIRSAAGKLGIAPDAIQRLAEAAA